MFSGTKPSLYWKTTGLDNLQFTRISNIQTVFHISQLVETGPNQSALLGDTGNFDYHPGTSGTPNVWLYEITPAIYNGSNFINGISRNFLSTQRTLDRNLISMVHLSAVGRSNQISIDRGNPRSWRGYIQEITLYTSSQASNREPIEYNINNYYNIYPQTSSFATSSFTIKADSTSISGSLNNKLTSGIQSSGPLGLVTVSRTGSNSLTIARNGVTSSFAVPASGALSTGIYLGAINNNGLALGNSPLNISFASVGTGLTGGDTQTLSTLVGGLQLNLRRIATDTDAYAFLAAANVTGIAEQIAVNTLVTDLKSYGVWTKMKALYPMVGGTANSHKFNLKDPRDSNDAFRLQFFGTWTHSSTGANPSGTSGTYADTFIIPNTDLINRNIHLSYYARAGSTTAEIGLFGNLTIRYNLYAGNKVYASLGSTYNDAIIGSQLVFHTVTSIDNSSNGQRAYSNGVLKSSVTNNSSGLGSTSLKLANDGGNFYRSIFECALASVGSGLTESEAANFYTAVQRFQTTLGRQV
jgi:hypothetical protein